MKILSSNKKNFNKHLDAMLLKRKNKINSNPVSVSNIIQDVKKNGDKAVLKYEKSLIRIKLLNQTQSKFLI